MPHGCIKQPFSSFSLLEVTVQCFGGWAQIGVLQSGLGSTGNLHLTMPHGCIKQPFSSFSLLEVTVQCFGGWAPCRAASAPASAVGTPDNCNRRRSEASPSLLRRSESPGKRRPVAPASAVGTSGNCNHLQAEPS